MAGTSVPLERADVRIAELVVSSPEDNLFIGQRIMVKIKG